MSANLNFGGVRFREQPRPIPLREYRQRRQAVGAQSWGSISRAQEAANRQRLWRGLRFAFGLLVAIALGFLVLGEIAVWLATA